MTDEFRNDLGMDTKVLAGRIRQARTTQGLTVVEASRQSGVARDTWTRVEAGKGAHDVTRQRILTFLGLDPEGVSPEDRRLAGTSTLSQASDVELLAEIARRFARPSPAESGTFTPFSTITEHEVDLTLAAPASDEVSVLSHAARDIGGRSPGQQRRDRADQAGEPPADDPGDLEPR